MSRIASLEGPHPTDAHVGERVRIRRKILRVSQAELAERVGLTFQQIHKYETGANRVSASMLYEIASVLETPVGFFFEGLSDAGAVRSERGNRAVGAITMIEQITSSSDGVELVEIMADLPSAFRRRLVSIAREVAFIAKETRGLVPERDVAAT